MVEYCCGCFCGLWVDFVVVQHFGFCVIFLYYFFSIRVMVFLGLKIRILRIC